jgi:tetratricopeptide (TPR) repeat protein
MSDPANRKQVNQKRTATKRLLQYFANLFQSRKQVQQIAAKDINAGGNVTIENIVQTIIQIVKPDRPRTLSIMLAQGGLVIFIVALLVAANNWKFSPSNAPSITYAPSTTVENKNTFLISNPPLSLLSKAPPSEAEKKEAQQKVAQYQQEVQKNRNSAVAHTNLGEALRRVGDLEGAAQEQQKALQLNSNMQEAKVGLALVEQDKGNLTTVKQEIQEALAQKETAFAYSYLADTLYQLKDLKGTEKAMRKAIDLDSNYAGYHVVLAAFLQEQGRIAEAISEYKEAIRIAPNEVVVGAGRVNLGIILADQGKLDEAINEYQKAIATDINLENEKAHSHLANALIKKGHWELAISECNKAIQINPNNAFAHVVWGLALAKQSIYGNLSRNPQSATLEKLAELKKKELKEVVEHFKKARDILRRQGKLQEAVEIDRRLREVCSEGLC